MKSPNEVSGPWIPLEVSIGYYNLAKRSPKDPGKIFGQDGRRLKSGEPVLYMAIAANNSIPTTLTLFNPK